MHPELQTIDVGDAALAVRLAGDRRAPALLLIHGFPSSSAQYGDAYRLCYVRGPEGILIALAQEIS